MSSEAGGKARAAEPASRQQRTSMEEFAHMIRANYTKQQIQNAFKALKS